MLPAWEILPYIYYGLSKDVRIVSAGYRYRKPTAYRKECQVSTQKEHAWKLRLRAWRVESHYALV